MRSGHMGLIWVGAIVSVRLREFGAEVKTVAQVSWQTVMIVVIVIVIVVVSIMSWLVIVGIVA